MAVVFDSLGSEKSKKHDGVLVWLDLFQHGDGAFAVTLGGSVDIENKFSIGVGWEVEFLDFDFFVGLERFVEGGAFIEFEFLENNIVGGIEIIRDAVSDLFVGKKIANENMALVGKKRDSLENVGEIICGKVGTFDGLVVFAEEFDDFLPGFDAVVARKNANHG